MNVPKTDAGQLAVDQGASAAAVAHLEDIAAHAAAFAATNARRGLPLDTFAYFQRGRTYNMLTPPEQSIVEAIYHELMSKGASAIGDIARAAVITTTNWDLISDRLWALMSQYRDQPLAMPCDSGDFVLADHPGALLKHSGKLKFVEGAEPHFVIAYDALHLGDERTPGSVARADVTPANVVRAMRRALNGELDGIEIRAQRASDLEAGKPAIRESDLGKDTVVQLAAWRS